MECVELLFAENGKSKIFWADAGTLSHRTEGKQGGNVVRAGVNGGNEVVRCEDIPSDASDQIVFTVQKKRAWG